MDVLCVGMYRSCSTWQYNVVSHLVRLHRGGCRLGFVSGEQYAGLPPDGAAGGWRVLKSHDGHPAFTAALAGGRARAVYAYRDLRDVAYSLVHKFGRTFEDVIEDKKFLHVCLANDAFWTAQPGTVCQRYEEITDHPAGAVAELAAHLEVPLGEGEAEELAAAYSLRSNLWRTVELANRLREQGLDLGDPRNALLHDRQTLLHWNHIREGRTGAWKDRVTPRQLACLVAACGDWLIERGYEHTPDWWRQLLEDLPRTAGEVRQELLAAQDELIRSLLRLRDAHEDHARTQEERTRAREELGRAREEMDRTREELARARRQTATVQAALTRLEQLGPVALGLARCFHNLSLRHPRLASTVKWLILRVSPRGLPG
jgi:hypothetical protein